MISFFCPFCKHVIKTGDEDAGMLIGCEQCKLEIRVPQPAAQPPIASAGSQTQNNAPPSWWRRVLRRGEISTGARF